MKALLAGEPNLAQAVASALDAKGFEAQVHPQEDPEGARTLAHHLVALERSLEAGTPSFAVGVGPTDASLALGITASKMGILFCAVLDAGEDRAAQRRILAALSELSPQGEPTAVAETIAERLHPEPDSA